MGQGGHLLSQLGFEPATLQSAMPHLGQKHGKEDEGGGDEEAKSDATIAKLMCLFMVPVQASYESPCQPDGDAAHTRHIIIIMKYL